MYSTRQIWKVAYPILISLFMQNLINITDTAYLGRVGEVELGASALAGVFYMALFMIGFGFSTGAQILMARRNGEGLYREIGAIMQQSTLFLLGLALVIFSFTYFYSPLILGKLITSEAVGEAAVKYMNWRIYGMFFSFVAIMFRAFFVGITQTKVLTINSVVMVLSNVVLNYVLIFGKYGFPEMGIAGAALASVISEAISVVFYTVYLFRKVDLRRYAFFASGSFRSGPLKRVLNISVWIMIQNFLTIGTWFLFFVAVEHLGERSLAVSNIVRSLSTLMFIPVSAFATTASTLVSNAIGAGRTGDLFPICRKIIGISFLVLLPVWLLIYLAPQLMLRIYTDNTELLQSAVPSLFVFAACYLWGAPGAVFFNAVSGTGNTRSALVIETGMLVFYVAYIWIAIFEYRVNVMYSWIAEHIYWFTMLLFSYIYLKKAHWQNKKI